MQRHSKPPEGETLASLAKITGGIAMRNAARLMSARVSGQVVSLCFAARPVPSGLSRAQGSARQAPA